MASTVVLLPVKRSELAKSRLAPLDPGVRRQLALAFAADTLQAAVACRAVDAVVVVSDDPAAAALAEARGCAVHGDADDLNAALRGAAATLALATRVVALCADLPALTAGELEEAITTAGEQSAFVSDDAGTGTTLYAAARDAFAPDFGAGSAVRHRAAGARELPGALRGLRRDVDDVAGLEAARRLGLGPHTSAVLAGLA